MVSRLLYGPNFSKSPYRGFLRNSEYLKKMIKEKNIIPKISKGHNNLFLRGNDEYKD